MSRFFTAGSSSESEEEEELSQDEEEVQIPSRFAQGSDSEEEEKRVVKSAKDKRFEELQTTVQRINNAIKINDWNQISTEFDKLNKQITNPKVKNFIEKDGKGTPKFYLKALADLEDFLKKVNENKSNYKMNATNQRSFQAMKQKLKKHNKNYEQEIENYRKGGLPDEEEKASSESEEEKVVPKKPTKAPTAAAAPVNKWMKQPGAKSESESESEDDMWDSEGESEGDEGEQKETQNKWMKAGEKKTVPKKEKAEKAEKVEKAPKGVKVTAKPEGPAKPVEMNPEEIRKALKEILAQRGKRNADPVAQEAKLRELKTVYAKTADLKLELLMALVSTQFDMNRSAVSYLPIEIWNRILKDLEEILTLLEENPQISLGEESQTEPEVGESELEDDEEPKTVPGNLLAFLTRLDEEFGKSLQAVDPHTAGYLVRLKDEGLFLSLCEQAQSYYTRIGNMKAAARVALHRVEHLYYKLDAPAPSDQLTPSDENNNNTSTETPVAPGTAGERTKEPTEEAGVDQKALLDSLALLIYAHGDERMKARAILFQIYHDALHDRFYEARDKMLMSHLPDSITHMDISTQILYNRTTVQLGLSAFRCNMIKAAHSCLSEIYSGGRVKELLAQGVTSVRHTDKTAEQSKVEKKRQLPFHLHIPLELVEAAHLITAMLLEVPNMAANAFDPKQKIISRFFRRQLDTYDRQVFTGPPENTREIITVAAKALSKGDWKKCEELILGLPIWTLVSKSDQVKAIVRRRIQEEGLRTYLFTYSSFYDSMSLESLSAMFELPKNTIHSIVSKMMISDELHASWDQPSGAIVMHKVEATRLQFLAMQFAEKASTFVENNERLLDTRFGYAKFESKTPQKVWENRGGQSTQNNTQSKGKKPSKPSRQQRNF